MEENSNDSATAAMLCIRTFKAKLVKAAHVQAVTLEQRRLQVASRGRLFSSKGSDQRCRTPGICNDLQAENSTLSSGRFSSAGFVGTPIRVAVRAVTRTRECSDRADIEEAVQAATLKAGSG